MAKQEELTEFGQQESRSNTDAQMAIDKAGPIYDGATPQLVKVVTA